jgi:hypothetical protein
MNAIYKRLRQMRDDELLGLSEAIDMELEHRIERTDPIPESARSRAIDRQHSYRRCNGAAAAPIRVVGLQPLQPAIRRRLAA